MKTLNINNGPINTAFNHINSGGTFSSEDKRGKHAPSNKTSDDIINKIKNHIESFPVIESHYVRKTSKRMFLDCKLSINKLYALYCKQHENDEQLPCLTVYKKVFGTNYNYAFF